MGGNRIPIIFTFKTAKETDKVKKEYFGDFDGAPLLMIYISEVPRNSQYS